MSFWQGFKIGALAALVYNLWKNPGGCCCCAVLLLIAVLMLGLVVVAFVMMIWKFLLAGMLLWGAVLVALAIRRSR